MPVSAEAPQPTAPVAKRKAPVVGVSGNGRIAKTFQMVTQQFESEYPDQHVRWVFHSANKPELSNVISRSVEGYRKVSLDEFSDTDLIKSFVDEKGDIRLADTIMMKIPRDQWEANRAERQRMAVVQRDSVKDQFDAAMDTVTQGKHRAVARGAASLEHRDHEYLIEQRSQE